ncbi:MAG: DUF169 domain-containing protein [Deltaproteobacteria bacterium]|nr:DUF169 domain-containing protein [Deltaproteobacteria bacterium]
MNQQATKERTSKDSPLTVNDVQECGQKIVSILELATFPVGVNFTTDTVLPTEALRLDNHRYCQALMLARQGQHVVLDKEGMACPAATAAFGFHHLPEGLRSGKGLVGFGIVSDPAVGRRMFADMPHLMAARIHHLELYPLKQANCIPQVVVVEGEVEQLMWLVLGYLHATGGQRVTASTAVLQATCVDATIIPFLEERLNFGFGCYGCRDATDLDAGESIIGFPASFLAPIVSHLEYLNAKAIPAARGKKAWRALEKKQGQE